MSSAMIATLALFLSQAPEASQHLSQAPDAFQSLLREIRGDTMPEKGGLRLGLQECIQRAFDRNPNAIAAAAQVRRAAALVEQARAASLPKLSANVLYTFVNFPVQFAIPLPGVDPIDMINQNQLAMNVNLAVPIVAPPAWARWAQAGDAASVATMGATEVRRQLAVAVAQTYVEVNTQRHVLEAIIKARDFAQGELDFTRRQVQREKDSPDVDRDQSQLSIEEAQVEGAQIALTRAQEALGVVVAGDEPVDVSEDPDFNALTGFAEERAQDELADLRPDILTLKRKLTLAEHRVRDDYTDYLPTLTGVFVPSYNTPTSATIPHAFFVMQFVLSFPLYDGGLRYGQAKERAALSVEAKANLEGAIRKAHAEVRAALEAVRRSDLAVKQAQEAADAAHRVLEKTARRYREGVPSNLGVVDAAGRARDQDIQLAQAKGRLAAAQVDALATSGRWP